MTKKRALIIDDSVVIRKQMHSFLGQINFDCVDAVNGEDALDVLSKNTDPFDIVFTDINMPKMDGLTFLEKYNEKGYKYPIVMMTTESATKLVDRAKSLGAYGWIIKPATLFILTAIIKKLEEKK